MLVRSDHDFPTPGYLLNVSGYMNLEENLNKEFEDDTEKKSLDNVCVYDVINGNSVLSINQMEIDKKIDSFTIITLHQLLYHHNISSEKNEIKNLLLTELEQFQEYYKGKYINFDFNLLQPECNIDELVENNVEIFNICVTALASLFVCKIHVFDILKNEETDIQGREFKKSKFTNILCNRKSSFAMPCLQKEASLERK